jgi:hypothetical protein
MGPGEKKLTGYLDIICLYLLLLMILNTACYEFKHFHTRTPVHGTFYYL